MEKSALQRARATYEPKLPLALRGPVKVREGKATESADNHEEIKKMFPNTYGMPLIEFIPGGTDNNQRFNVGIILSGGQAPGGHNVITGLYDTIKNINSENRLYGFLLGPAGLVEHNYIELTEEVIEPYRNTGGFDMIGSGRTKLEREEQYEKAYEIIRKLDINAIVIVGGDDSNTNACVLAEYYASKNYPVQVIGCPKTIDGDLKNNHIETSFGFDSATKTYCELIGNVERDANSARKYWHFIKVMGRSASHIALECALQCRPNMCIISEEIETKDLTLIKIVDQMCEVIAERATDGNNFGTIIIPEGLVEFFPSIGRLIDELNDLLLEHGDEYRDLDKKSQRHYIISHLSESNSATFKALPYEVARQLALDRDPHGNVQVSLIETEKLLAEMCADRLKSWEKEGRFKGKFSAIYHFFGYEGRCAVPSNFDANYCYALGASAAQLVAHGKTGYMAIIKNTIDAPENWRAGGVPISMMLNLERRNGEIKPVIRKALVDLKDRPFKTFAAQRRKWAKETAYAYPGPIQYWGPSEVCDRPTMTLQLERGQ